MATRKTTPPGAPPVRERILDAAVRVLSRDGVKSLAQPQIAREAGVPQGHLTYYFPKKVDLVRGVAEHMRNTILQELAPTLARSVSARADARPPSMRERFVALATRLAKDRGRTRVLLALLVEMEHDADLHAELAQLVSGVRTLVATALERDLDDPDVDVTLAAAWGIGLQHLILEGQRSDEETERLYDRLIGLMASTKSPSGSS